MNKNGKMKKFLSKIKEFWSNEKYRRRTLIVLAIIAVIIAVVCSISIKSKSEMEEEAKEVVVKQVQQDNIIEEVVQDEFGNVIIVKKDDKGQIISQTKSEEKSETTQTSNAVTTTENVSGSTGNGTVSNASSSTNAASNKTNNTTNDNNNQNAKSEPEVEEYVDVTLQIRCDAISNNNALTDGGQKFEQYASNPQILYQNMTVKKGTSVYQALVSACQQNGIHYDADYSATYNSAYVRGINYLYEKDAGPRSGWMYSVNGTSPNKGASRYTLNGGENIIWYYVK